MQHPGINAEIARLRHTETLRASRREHELRYDTDVEDLYTVTERVAPRIVARLTPEFFVSLPHTTVLARRACGAQA